MAAPVAETVLRFPLKISDQIALRVQVRQQWDADFEKNYQVVASSISVGVQSVIQGSLRKFYASPYASHQSSFQAAISFDICDQQTAGEIERWAAGTAQLPPFKEWFQTFKGPSFEKGGADEVYFHARFARIGAIVKANLQAMLTALASYNYRAQLKCTIEPILKQQPIPENLMFKVVV